MRETEYTDDEKRVCAYIEEMTEGNIGCGDDPIAFLIASHRLAHVQLAALRKRCADDEEQATLVEQG